MHPSTQRPSAVHARWGSTGPLRWIMCAVSALSACSTEGGSPKDASPGPPEDVVRFVALGDTGEGNEAQHAVGQAMGVICAERGCDFALLLGDNFYNSGVDAADDPQFHDKFEAPYAHLGFPFYVVLGNHDYGGDGLGSEPDRPLGQLDYAMGSTQWVMPARHYRHDHGHASFFGLDTNAILWDTQWGGAQDQLDWLRAETAASDARWKVAYGHHPYLSNGRHGNAGDYEGLAGVPLIAGQDVKDFVEDGVCGEMDLYLAGHDHDLQWLEPKCGVEFVVSGAGAKTRSLVGRGSETFFETDATEGFVWFELADERLHGVVYDRNAQVLFEREISQEDAP